MARYLAGVSAPVHHVEDLCVVAPSPEMKEKLIDQFDRLRNRAADLVGRNISLTSPRHVGLNDGLIYPGTYYPVGTTALVAQRAAMERAPLRGVVRVVVVLADFSDKAMAAGAEARFRDLFFSTGVLPHGSVKEYYSDTSGGMIDIQGEVVGPYRMPRTLAAYAGADNGMQGAAPNARTMANDALTLADPHVNFGPYDNDGNGYVDAFIVVHAGRGAEETGNGAEIWSHKWVLPAERSVDSTKVFAYLTIPEDAKVGVSVHELGHLLFGWPDLYDTDNTSEGIGSWCVMASGSWGLGGDRPTHPSAWCKSNQGWINVVSQTSNANVTVNDVKSSRTAYRLWKDGGGGNEYFLVENRQQTGFDASMPGEGLLIWHIDEATATNTNEAHYKVALMQADGNRDLENNINRGDAGDSFPGTSGNASFTNTSTPNSKSYAGSDTCVSVTGIPASATAMPVQLSVRCITFPPKSIAKDFIDRGKDLKELRKEFIKERPKEFSKERPKEFAKDLVKDRKEGFENKLRDTKFTDKFAENKLGEGKLSEGKFADEKFADHKLGENPFGASQPYGGPPEAMSVLPDHLEDRLTMIEQSLTELLSYFEGGGVGAWSVTGGDPFITQAERPSVGMQLGQPDFGQANPGQPDLDAIRAQMEAGSAEAKRAYDSLPPQ